ncbi:hypothetical protein [Anaerospora sp.]|uniref:hypothetical protein n=1 Tax=Anaerospora sp. TaxID=1960278 RepID=UPI0028999C2C|nr:hypothetical protein [Anaerospora sp.]
MVSTLKLSDVINKWRDALKASTSIRDFCMMRYNKSPKIFIGTDPKQSADTEYPLIILYPGAKEEGLELQEYTYKLTVKWAVLQSQTVKTGDVTEYAGVAECDELGQLIYMELAGLNTDNPVSHVRYNLDPVACYPCFPGWMDITLKITPVNGYSIQY